MGVSREKAKKAAAKSVLTERQQKWFASVEASLERDTGKSIAEFPCKHRVFEFRS